MMSQQKFHNAIAKINPIEMKKYLDQKECKVEKDDIRWLTNNLPSTINVKDFFKCIDLLRQYKGTTTDFLGELLKRYLGKYALDLQEEEISISSILRYLTEDNELIDKGVTRYIFQKLENSTCYVNALIKWAKENPPHLNLMQKLAFQAIGSFHEHEVFEALISADPDALEKDVHSIKLIEHIVKDSQDESSLKLLSTSYLDMKPVEKRNARAHELLNMATAHLRTPIVKMLTEAKPKIDISKEIKEDNLIENTFWYEFRKNTIDSLHVKLELYFNGSDDMEDEDSSEIQFYENDFTHFNESIQIAILLIKNFNLELNDASLKDIKKLYDLLEDNEHEDVDHMTKYVENIRHAVQRIIHLRKNGRFLIEKYDQLSHGMKEKIKKEGFAELIRKGIGRCLIELVSGLLLLKEHLIQRKKPDELSEEEIIKQFPELKSEEEHADIDELRERYIKPFADEAMLNMDRLEYLKKLTTVLPQNVFKPAVNFRKHSGSPEEAWKKSAPDLKFVTLLQENKQYKIYSLPLGKSIDQIRLALCTTLAYHLMTKAWDSEICLELQKLIIKVISKLNGSLTEEHFYKTYAELEKKEYYGECPSDDSDNEQINIFESQPIRVRNALTSSAAKMMEYGQVERIFWKKREKGFRKPEYPRKAEKKKKNKEQKAEAVEIEEKEAVDPVGMGKIYEVTERAVIHHDASIPISIYHDLSLLNQYHREGKLNEDTLKKQIKTLFFIAQYRGIHYDFANWSKKTRAKHRKMPERNNAMFAEAVYKKTGLSIKKVDGPTEEEIQRLTHAAELLLHQVYCLRFTGRIESSYIGEKAVFNNGLYALQDFYTKSYDKHKKFCLKIYNKKIKQEKMMDPAEVILLFSVGSENYNLSTGDTPYHPLRYALGLKSYGKGKGQRLQPRWRATKTPERPYSGKMYTYLFDIMTYFNSQPRHLISLDYIKELNIDSRILAERETTFSAMIPKGVLVESTVMKYPGFEKEHSGYHEHRYGMKKDMYEQFDHDLFSSDSTPHSEANKRAKFLLGEHLCAYYEACLIEDARLEAQRRGGFLIYHDYLKGFSIVPPPSMLATRGEREETGNEQRLVQKEKKEARLAQQADGDLVKILLRYCVIPGDTIQSVLIKLCHLSENDIMLTPSTEEEKKEDKSKSSSNSRVTKKPQSTFFKATCTIPKNKWLPAFKEEVAESMKGAVKEFFQQTLDYLLAVATKNFICFKILSFLLKTNMGIEITPPGYQAIKGYKLLYLGGDGFHGLEENKEEKTKTSSSSSSTVLPSHQKSKENSRASKRKAEEDEDSQPAMIDEEENGSGHTRKLAKKASLFSL